MVTTLAVMLLSLSVWFRFSVAYGFFVLAQQWPPSLCNIAGRTCVPPVKRDFTIHGLWPNLYSGTQLQYCTNTPFDRRQIATIRNQLIAEWPNVYNVRQSESFWRYQWSKHGTCSETVYPHQSAYFRLPFIRSQYDLKAILAAQNIIPGTGGTYSANFIISTIQSQTQTVVRMVCNGNSTNPRSQLQEIRICLNQLATGLIDCPGTVRNNCNQFVSFPN